jgi:hypothetical protein
MASVTRKSNVFPVFGVVSDFKSNQLPTHADVIKSILFRRMQLKKDTGKDPSNKDICKTLAERFSKIYGSASIPSVTVKQIGDKILSYHNKYQTLIKPYKARCNVESYKQKLDKFLEDSKKLFNFSSCKCRDFHSCNCPKEKKIPKIEQQFLSDQRNDRLMFIGSVDVNVTKKLQKRTAREAVSEPTRSEISIETISLTSDSSLNSESDLDEFVPPKRTLKRLRHEDEDSFEESFDDSVTGVSSSKLPASKIPKTLTNFAIACDRVGVSDRGAALLSSSLLEDISITESTIKSPNIILDKNKIRRERSKTRLNTKKQKSVSQITSIYFDGKRDITLIDEKRGNKIYRKKITEDHISVISEPDSQYVGHFTPGSGSALSIYRGILHLCTTQSLPLEPLVAIGCDGTNVNTGSKGGIIKLIEESLEKPLHWFVCMLHGNELPLRHLFASLDGKTSGPRCFTGVIGKELQSCETKPIVPFDPIAVVLHQVDVTTLSTDQKYLYQIHQAISVGEVSHDLSSRSPGGLNHARWITTANRILRLYVSTEEPSHNLVTLTHFVMEVYAPMWFIIKGNPYVQSGPKHIFQNIDFIRKQSKCVQSIVMPVVRRNAYFAHSESILLAMVSDDRPEIRELGWRRIKNCRSAIPSSESVRVFKSPKVNFECKDYIDLIDWRTDVTEPPLTMHFTDEEIENHIENKELYQSPKYPLHTQAVERNIKLVSEVSLLVCSQEARDGVIRNKLASRQRISSFESKQDYK